jgi:hypothetical protein
MISMRLNQLAILCQLNLALCACGSEPGPMAAGDAVGASRATRAVAQLVALASAPDAGRSFGGSASFTATRAGVDLLVVISNCEKGFTYQLAILEGRDCTSSALRDAAWAMGGALPRVGCLGTGGARGSHSQPSSGANPWTIGGPASSNLLGHAFVVRSADGAQPLACGVITADQSAPTSEAGPADAGANADASGLRAEVLAQLAGICLARKVNPKVGPGCPDPQAFARCAEEHCALSACAAACADYSACLQQSADVCKSGCSMTQPCGDCSNRTTRCAIDYCAGMLACATTVTPGGPCSKVEACCAKQGERAEQCLTLVHQAEQLSGDGSCMGLILDQDFNGNIGVGCSWD